MHDICSPISITLSKRGLPSLTVSREITNAYSLAYQVVHTDLTLNDVKEHAEKLMSHMKFTVLVNGNMQKEVRVMLYSNVAEGLTMRSRMRYV